LGGASAAALAIGFPSPARARDSITLDQFRALSARLTGAALTDLDAGTAGKLLDGFIGLGRGPDLALLAADPNLSTGTVADDIVGAWYSGAYETPTGLAAIRLDNALLWDALDFTKPPGLCGGETGYWAEAPQS